MRNVLDTTGALEAVKSYLMKALVNVRGEGTPSGSKGCSFKEFYEYPFPMFKGNLNSGEVRVWLMRLEELLRVMDYTEEQRVKYAVVYKFNCTCQLHESIVIKWMCKCECRTHRESALLTIYSST